MRTLAIIVAMISSFLLAEARPAGATVNTVPPPSLAGTKWALNFSWHSPEHDANDQDTVRFTVVNGNNPTTGTMTAKGATGPGSGYWTLGKHGDDLTVAFGTSSAECNTWGFYGTWHSKKGRYTGSIERVGSSMLCDSGYFSLNELSSSSG